MLIKDKEALKSGIKEEIERFVKDFPVYFWEYSLRTSTK